MGTDKTLKSMTADFLKSVYSQATNPDIDITERLAAARTFKENWRLYIQDHQIPAETSLKEIGISDKYFVVLHRMRQVALTDLNHRYENILNDQSSSIPKRADQAFELIRDVENMRNNFSKEWEFAYPKDHVGDLKSIFNYESVSMDAFGSLNNLPQLVYDLNLKAARSIYQNMIKNPKAKVQETNHEIFRYVIQAGFDDVAAKSLNNGKYEHDVEVYVRAVDPKLGWEDFYHKMSNIAIKRGELKRISSYFGPLPKNMGDFGMGRIKSPSTNMRRFAATR